MSGTQLLQPKPSDLPFFLSEKTYNTSHPEFRSWMTGSYRGKIYDHGFFERALLNFPNISFDIYHRLVTRTRARYLELGLLYGLDRITGLLPVDTENLLFKALRPMMRGKRISDRALEQTLAECRREILEDIPVSGQVFERKAWMNNWMDELNARSTGTYFPGWVDDRDGLFLYWAIRTLKPKTIVQTGVCNGLSIAYMAMALERNGGEGKIHAIDLPHIYDPDDPEWNRPVVYGVIIPPQKSSGWIAKEVMPHRVDIQVGDARELLPGLLENLGEVDVFYHDSDHSYDHMMFELNAAKGIVRAGGLYLCDDVSWNRSTWEFARQEGLPAYNFCGSLGVIFA